MTTLAAAITAKDMCPQCNDTCETPHEHPVHKKSEKIDQPNTPTVRKFKDCSLLLGFLNGFFILFSMLIIALWKQDRKYLIGIFVASFLAFGISGVLLQTLVSMGFHAKTTTSCNNNALHGKHEVILKALVCQMQFYFYVGYVVGMCMACFATNFLVDTKAAIMCDVVAVEIVVVLCIMILLSERNEKIDETIEGTDDKARIDMSSVSKKEKYQPIIIAKVLPESKYLPISFVGQADVSFSFTLYSEENGTI